MATGFGHQAWIGLGVETTYGTPVAPSSFVEITEESIRGAHTPEAKTALRHISKRDSVRSTKSVEGSFGFYGAFEGPLQRLLLNAMGAVGTTGAGPFTHDFTLATALPTGLTLHVNRDAAAVGAGSAFEYDGCQISTLTLSQTVGEPLQVTAEILGEDWRNVNVATPTFVASTLIDYEMLAPGVVVNGVTVPISEMEITIDNALAAERYKLGSRLRRGLGRGGPRSVNVTMTAEFEDLATYALYRDLTASTGNFTAAWVSGTKSLNITIPKLYLTGDDPQVGSEPGPIQIAYNGEARQNAAANDEMTAQLVNDTATVT